MCRFSGMFVVPSVKAVERGARVVPHPGMKIFLMIDIRWLNVDKSAFISHAYTMCKNYAMSYFEMLHLHLVIVNFCSRPNE